MNKSLPEIGTIAFAIVVCICGYYLIFYPHSMPFQFDCAMAMDGNTHSPSSFYYAPTEDWFLYWIDTSEDIPQLVVRPDLSHFDFEKYDYLLYKGKKLTSLNYSPWLTYTEDEIHYDKRIPLISTLEDASLDTLYIYKIKKTNKFRPPGP